MQTVLTSLEDQIKDQADQIKKTEDATNQKGETIETLADSIEGIANNLKEINEDLKVPERIREVSWANSMDKLRVTGHRMAAIIRITLSC
ncbi:MAG: hypothetical protein M1819_002156 [Sarea resinae]|nr:MAG: hypothetical protein M1819_002156 [Sarea resinae]